MIFLHQYVDHETSGNMIDLYACFYVIQAPCTTLVFHMKNNYGWIILLSCAGEIINLRPAHR